MKIINYECDICGDVAEDVENTPGVGHWVEVPNMPKGDLMICPECTAKIAGDLCATK